jgi:8-oxo-dGTP diphosphatase
MADDIHVTVSGSADTVIGKVGGDFNRGPSLTLARHVDELRQSLAATLGNGGLDEATYTAAKAELDLAADCLPATDERRRTAFVLALKRLRGLVEDVSDIAVRVAAALAAVHGMR